MTSFAKKTISLVLVLLLMLTVMPLAFAESGEAGNLRWDFNASSGKLTLTGTGAMQNFAAGAEPWHTKSASVRSVVIGENITTIGSNAFKGYTNLTDITFSGMETSIGAHAFDGCTALLGVTLPAALTTIGTEAFARSGLSSVTLPANVNSVEAFAFFGCSNLKSFYVAAGNASFAADASGCLLNAAKTNLLLAPAGQTECTVSNAVKEIAPYAFYGCSKLGSVAIPEGLTKIGKWAFWKCAALKTIAIPPTVKRIENGAFCECTSLQSVAIPADTTYVGNRAFYGCTSLQSVIVENKDCELNEMLESITKDPSDEYLSQVGTYQKGNVTIYGETGSTAEAYAKKYDRPFKSTSETQAEENTLTSRLPDFFSRLVEMIQAMFAKATELMQRLAAAVPETESQDPETPSTPSDTDVSDPTTNATNQVTDIFQSVISIIQNLFQNASTNA